MWDTSALKLCSLSSSATAAAAAAAPSWPAVPGGGLEYRGPVRELCAWRGHLGQVSSLDWAEGTAGGCQGGAGARGELGLCCRGVHTSVLQGCAAGVCTRPHSCLLSCAGRFLLSSSYTKEVKLWSEEGALVGVFGMGLWALDNPATWQASCRQPLGVRAGPPELACLGTAAPGSHLTDPLLPLLLLLLLRPARGAVAAARGQTPAPGRRQRAPAASGSTCTQDETGGDRMRHTYIHRAKTGPANEEQAVNEEQK